MDKWDKKLKSLCTTTTKKWFLNWSSCPQNGRKSLLYIWKGIDNQNIQEFRQLTPVILATQEAEIRRIMVQSQPRQIVQESVSQKKKIHHKKGLVE
jgi:hypothetical protein